MLAAIALAILHRGSPMLAPEIPSGPLFEETVEKLRMPGYHPMIRFSSWDITRFNRSSTYQFRTPDMVQQGQFENRNDQYQFRAVMANEIENADKMKLMADMAPGQAQKFDQAYARSMSNFPGAFYRSTQCLVINYPIDGVWREFKLYDMTLGDDRRSKDAKESEWPLVGLWHQPEPYPEKLDAKTRQKIQENGLQIFFGEAGASEAAMFNVLDLHTDRTYRAHGKTGDWNRNGNTLYLDHSPTFEISQDGNKLLKGGKVVLVKY